MTDVTPFQFDGHEVRTVHVDGEPWWIAADVCRALEIANSRDAVAKLDDDERADVGLTDTSSNGTTQKRNVTVINEGGLYTLILRCRDATTPGTLPHRFRKWVTSEVLPSIRKTGSYAAQAVPAVSRFLLRVENGVPTAVEPYRGEAAMMADLTGVVAALAQQVAEMKAVRYEPPAAAPQTPAPGIAVMTLKDAADILYAVIKAYGSAGIQANHLTRKSQMLRQATRDAALRLLVNQGRVIRQDFGTSSVGGRPGSIYRVAAN